MSPVLSMLLAIGCGIVGYYCLLVLAHVLTHLVVLLGRFHVSK